MSSLAPWSNQVLHSAVTDLFWSLWTEMGAPGTIRNHQRIAIDPEPLLVATPSVFSMEPRLRDQVYRWCWSNSKQISKSRLHGLSRARGGGSAAAFADFTRSLQAATGINWTKPVQHAGIDPNAPPSVDKRPLRLPVERPALVRFRLRALSGVGTRSDVLATLLAAPERWVSAADLAVSTGYAKRGIAHVLAELSAAGITMSVEVHNTNRHKLNEGLSGVVVAGGLAFPNWSDLFEIVTIALALADLETSAVAVQRVKAHKHGERLKELAEMNLLEPPPSTRGRADAWHALMAWLTIQMMDLANGTSAALRR